jgi:PAS domain S-box-containing protein
MPLHTPLSLFCSVVSASLGTFVLARDARSAPNQTLSVLFFSISWWAFSEFMWNNAATAGEAMRWLKIGEPGYIFLGSFYLQFTLAFTGRAARLRTPAVLIGLFGAPLLVVLLSASGVPLFNSVSQTFWGWAYHPAPLYLLYLAHILACFSLGIWLTYRFTHEATTRAERAQARLTLVSMLLPIVIGVFTDGILPVLEVQLVRLGTVIATSIYSVFVYAMIRYRAPLLTPESVSEKVLGTIPDAVFLVDSEGALRHVNPATVALTGRTEKSLRGIHVRELIEITTESEAEGALGFSALRDLRDAEMKLRARDGRRVPIALTTSALCNDEGDLVGLVGVARDLSALKRLQAQVVRSDKLAAVGRLASGIGHEINNPITYIRMNLRTLSEQVEAVESFCTLQRTLVNDAGEGGVTCMKEALAKLTSIAEKVRPDLKLEEMSELLEESVEGAARIQEIVRTMSTFSHVGSGPPAPVDLDAEIQNALRIAQNEIKGRVEVHRDLAGMRPLLAQPLELQQVLVNLLANAAQAVGPTGNIWIRSFEADGWGVLEVEDDGHGIDPGALPHIFDPFFTTKEVGKGTGLGLAISYQLLERMGGRIAVRSSNGGGAIFRVELPLAAP